MTLYYSVYSMKAQDMASAANWVKAIDDWIRFLEINLADSQKQQSSKQLKTVVDSSSCKLHGPNRMEEKKTNKIVANHISPGLKVNVISSEEDVHNEVCLNIKLDDELDSKITFTPAEIPTSDTSDTLHSKCDEDVNLDTESKCSPSNLIDNTHVVNHLINKSPHSNLPSENCGVVSVLHSANDFEASLIMSVTQDEATEVYKESTSADTTVANSVLDVQVFEAPQIVSTTQDEILELNNESVSVDIAVPAENNQNALLENNTPNNAKYDKKVESVLFELFPEVGEPFFDDEFVLEEENRSLGIDKRTASFFTFLFQKPAESDPINGALLLLNYI